MYALLLTLLLAFGPLTPVFAEEPAHSRGCEAPVTGAYTTSLTNALVGVNSSSINVGAVSVIYLRSSGTSSTQLMYQFSDDGTNWGPGVTIAHGAWCLAKRGRYLRFAGSGSTTGTVSVKYYLATVAGGGGTTTADQGAAGASPWPVVDTATNTRVVYLSGTNREIFTYTSDGFISFPSLNNAILGPGLGKKLAMTGIVISTDAPLKYFIYYNSSGTGFAVDSGYLPALGGASRTFIYPPKSIVNDIVRVDYMSGDGVATSAHVNVSFQYFEE